MKPEVSLGLGAGVVAIVGAVYYNALPPLVDVRVGPAQNKDIAAARKTAAWTSAGVTAAVSILAKDPTVFALGAGATILFDWWYRHANAVDPRAGKVNVGAALVGAGAPTQMDDSASFPGYSDDIVGSEFAY